MLLLLILSASSILLENSMSTSNDENVTETPSQPPDPTRTPFQTLEVMKYLQSNKIEPHISVIAVISIVVMGTVVAVYFIFYLAPFVRDDVLPRIE